MGEGDLAGVDRLFAYDPKIACDLLRHRPSSVEVCPNQTQAVATWDTEVAGRPVEVEFVILPKAYPDGAPEEVLELKRQIRYLQENLPQKSA